MPRATLLFAAVIALTPSRAQVPEREPPARVFALVAELSDDSLQGRDTGSRGSAIAARIIADSLRAYGILPAGDSGTYFQHVPYPGGPAVNVIGILPGADPALRDTAIVIDAHYDHIGVGRPVHGDSIYNGADDDASGTVAVIEAARLVALGPRPKRSLVFLLVTGEERGLVGSRWYLQHPAVPLARTAADLEIEMIGRPDPLAGGPGKAWLTGYERSTMGGMLRDAGVPVVPDPRPDEHFFERSDNIAFAYRGIVAHTISSFNLHADYHQPSDEVRFVDPAHMATVVESVARAARILADGPRPDWLPGGQPRR